MKRRTREGTNEPYLWCEASENILKINNADIQTRETNKLIRKEKLSIGMAAV
jgi:hypothetical protein